MLAAAACSEGTPVAPEPVTVAVVLDYLQPRIPGPPPPPLLPELTGCLHHFAPAQLQIATSWGATARLTPRGDRVFAALLLNVPAPAGHWVSIVDIEFCNEDPRAPYITRGLQANGVTLTGIVEVQVGEMTRRALAFQLDTDGRVTP